MTEQYLKEFERWVAGPKAHKQQLRAELEAHLREAEAAGDAGALSRLGTPREAAEVFSQGRDLVPAPLPKRIAASLTDVAVPILLFVLGAALGAWTTKFGPGFEVDGNNARFWSMELTAVFSILAGIVWWVIALPLLEWRKGRTLGKALFGLRTVSESGIAPSFGQVILRRLTLFFSGPLQLIDWAWVFFNKKHQRGLDVLAKTLVVSDPSEDRAPVAGVVNAHP